MKLRYFFGAFLSAMFFVGCSSDDDPIGTLDGIRLSETFVTIPATGGDVAITVTASGEWKFDEIFSVNVATGQKDENGKDITEKKFFPLPVQLNKTKTDGEYAWLTADRLSGSAGETVVTFHADASDAGRETMLQITIGGKTQFLLVRQGSLEAAAATCAEIIAGPDSKTYLVTGTVKSIANTTYGNWYLEDATGQVYIYGTLDKDGKTKNFTSLGLEVGDVVTVSGPKTTYNGTVELVDVTVIKIVKALLKIDATEASVGAAGGDVEVKVAYKGNGTLFAIEDAAKEWVWLKDSKYISGVKTIREQNPADTVVYTFTVLPNSGDSRKANLVFSSNSGKDKTEINYSIKQAASVLPHGKTATDPFTVAEAIAKCIEIGSTTDGEIYFAKGKISSIKEVSTSYGNATFNISDNGQDENALTCFRSLFLDNEKFTDEKAIEVGDEVIVCGKLVNYSGTTPEFSGNVYIYSLKKGGSPSGTPGTLAQPFTPAEANAFCQSQGEGNTSDTDYYVKGKIIEITDNNQFGTQYGNCTFYLSADGNDSADKFYVFRTLYLGNVKYTDDSWLKPKAGDEVIVCGKFTLYKDKNGNLIPETSANNSYIYSLNGKTK